MLLLSLVLALGPEPLEAILERGTQHAAAGDFESAISAFKAAQKSYSEDPLPLCYIGLAYTRSGEWSLAHAYLSRCQLSNPKPPLWVVGAFKETVAALNDDGFVPVAFSANLPGAVLLPPGFTDDDAVPLPTTIYLQPGDVLLEGRCKNESITKNFKVIAPSTPPVLLLFPTSSPSSAQHQGSPPPKIKRVRWPGYALIAAGAAGAVLGTVFYAMGANLASRVRPKGQGFEEDIVVIERDYTAAYALWGTGAAMLAGGLVLTFLPPTASTENPDFPPTAMLLLSGRF